MTNIKHYAILDGEKILSVSDTSIVAQNLVVVELSDEEYDLINSVGIQFVKYENNEVVELTDEEKIAIDDQIGENYTIYQYMYNKNTNRRVAPFDNNYSIVPLRKKEYYEKGELIKVEYWGSKDSEGVYSKLCVQEDFVYDRPVNEYVEKIHRNIRWVKNDWSYSETKTMITDLSIQDSANFGVDVRKRILTDVKITIVGLVQLTEQVDLTTAEDMGKVLLAQIVAELDQFEDWDRQPLIDKISGIDVSVETELTWLENDSGVDNWNNGVFSIREYLIYLLS